MKSRDWLTRVTRNSLLEGQLLALVSRWDRLMDQDPSRVQQEASRYLRWLERIEPRTTDDSILQSIAWQICLEAIADAEARRR